MGSKKGSKRKKVIKMSDWQSTKRTLSSDCHHWGCSKEKGLPRGCFLGVERECQLRLAVLSTFTLPPSPLTCRFFFFLCGNWIWSNWSMEYFSTGVVSTWFYALSSHTTGWSNPCPCGIITIAPKIIFQIKWSLFFSLVHRMYCILSFDGYWLYNTSQSAEEFNGSNYEHGMLSFVGFLRNNPMVSRA